MPMKSQPIAVEYDNGYSNGMYWGTPNSPTNQTPSATHAAEPASTSAIFRRDE